MAKKSIVPGLSFSWKRAAGITKIKTKIAKKLEYQQQELVDKEK